MITTFKEKIARNNRNVNFGKNPIYVTSIPFSGMGVLVNYLKPGSICSQKHFFKSERSVIRHSDFRQISLEAYSIESPLLNLNSGLTFILNDCRLNFCAITDLHRIPTVGAINNIVNVVRSDSEVMADMYLCHKFDKPSFFCGIDSSKIYVDMMQERLFDLTKKNDLEIFDVCFDHVNNNISSFFDVYLSSISSGDFNFKVDKLSTYKPYKSFSKLNNINLNENFREIRLQILSNIASIRVNS